MLIIVKNGKEILVTDNKDKSDISLWSQSDENFLVKHSRMFFSACDECVNELIHHCEEDHK